MRLSRLPFALLAAIALNGCGSSDSTGPTPVAIENETFASSLQVNLAAMTKLPSGVYVRDLSLGTGVFIPPSANIRVYFAGFLVNGRSFDTNIGLAAVNFALNDLIQGWQQGVPGMRVGGIRKLVIPWQLGYGAAGSDRVPPYANLVFDIEVLRLN